LRDGAPCALFNRFGAIVDLEAARVLVRDPALRGGHNLELGDDGLAVVNDTLGATVRVYDLAAGRLVRAINLRDFAWVRALESRTREGLIMRAARRIARRPASARPLFVRGLVLDGARAFIGLSPASIVCLDWRRGVVLDTFQYSDDVRCCVHGLALAPEAP
jgi:hypothetical protein